MRAWRFGTYALVGLAGTATQYSTLLALVHLRLAAPVAASCVGAVLGAMVNYALNYHVTFRCARDHRAAAARFFTVAAAALVANWAAMVLLTSWCGVHYLVAQCLSTAAVLTLTYSANARWSFGQNAIDRP